MGKLPKGRGCTPETAARIIDVLFNESGGGALLLINNSFKDHNMQGIAPPPPKPPSPDRQPHKRGGTTKITPEILNFAHDPTRRVWSVPEIQRAIKETFGISMSTCTIYKIWKMNPGKAKGDDKKIK